MKECDLVFLEDNIKMYQLVNGFRFSVDPILLVDFFEGNKDGKILDIGSGTGIIPILLAKKKQMKNIYGLEIQKVSVDIFKENISINHLNEKIIALNEDIKNVKYSNFFDYVISNPPYLKIDGKKISENENKKIARHEIYLKLEDLIKNAKRVLKPRGEFFLVHRSYRIIEISRLLEENNFSLKRICFVYFDREKNSNLVLVQASKGRKNLLKIESPIFLKEKGY